MSDKSKVLLQLDPDPQPSSFDAFVAYDAGINHLLQYGNVQPEQVEAIVQGAMFTRGPADLKHSAIFIGGSDLDRAQSLLDRVRKTLFDPLRVSVMFDPNGAETTAAAAATIAAKQLRLHAITATVLGGTGPVGFRVAQLLAGQGAQVRVVSRNATRAEQVCGTIRGMVDKAKLEPIGASSAGEYVAACRGAELLVACGKGGIEFLPAPAAVQLTSVQLAIDLNAAPPVGLGWFKNTAAAKVFGSMKCWGALAVGGLKMKTHKAALRTLFEQAGLMLCTKEIFDIAQNVEFDFHSGS